MKSTLAIAIFIVISGCIPVPLITTKQPAVEAEIVSHDGSAIEGAQYHFVTYSISFGIRGEQDDIQVVTSDKNGRVTLPEEQFTQIVILAPDQGTFYRWAFCVEKEGYRSFTKNQLNTPDFEQSEIVVLNKSNQIGKCIWNGNNREFEI